MIGVFSIKDSLWYNFSLKKNTCDLVFDRKEIVLPARMELVRANLSSSQKFLTMELRPYQEKINKDKKEEEIKPDKAFRLCKAHYESLTHDPAPTNQHARELLPSIFGKQCHRYISNIEDGNNDCVSDLLEQIGRAHI